MATWPTLFTDFGRILGLADFDIESTGACRLELDERIALDFELDLEGALHLYCVMPPVAQADRPAAALRLLSENYAMQRRHSLANFLFDEGLQQFLLHLRMPASIQSLADFEAVVRQFVEHAEHWHSTLSSGVFAGEPSPPGFAINRFA
jgi:hypothetical protein